MLTILSRKPHDQMIANVDNVETLLQVSFGRGIKYLSTPPSDSNHENLSALGERLCTASLKCFLVRSVH